jgi:hypothetical protein
VAPPSSLPCSCSRPRRSCRTRSVSCLGPCQATCKGCPCDNSHCTDLHRPSPAPAADPPSAWRAGSPPPPPSPPCPSPPCPFLRSGRGSRHQPPSGHLLPPVMECDGIKATMVREWPRPGRPAPCRAWRSAAPSDSSRNAPGSSRPSGPGQRREMLSRPTCMWWASTRVLRAWKSQCPRSSMLTLPQGYARPLTFLPLASWGVQCDGINFINKFDCSVDDQPE